MKCLFCDKEINSYSLYSLLVEEDLLCSDCRNKLKLKHQKFIVDDVEVETFYEYDSLFKEVLLQYKECYDEALKDIFLYKIKDYLKIKFHSYKILYVPSSKTKLEERGFNHLKEIFKELNLEEVVGLKMKKEISQQSKNSSERKLMETNYYFENENYFCEKLLIVDDVFTTGSSLRGTINVMKKHCLKIKAIILAKT